jgi:peptidyl-prolyl cis-trans isomerase SurA
MRRLALSVAVLLALSLAPAAQELQRIAAIVNEDVISMYDLKARIDIVVVTSRLPDSPEMRQRLQPQVLRSMIDERLEMQEAKRRNVSVTKADLDRAVTAIEEDNNMPRGGLSQYLKDAGLREENLMDQIRASIAWQKVISRQFRPTVNITPEQVDEALEQIKKKQGQEEARVYEILLTVDSPDEENTVRDNGRRLVEQIRGGAVFDALARQFSQGANAAIGGDRGWVVPDDSEAILADAVRQLRIGEVSEPLRTIAGFHILTVRERRRGTGSNPGEAKVSLNQIFLPSTGSGSSDRQAQIELAQTLRETVNGCADMQKAAQEARSPRPAHLGDYQMKDLSPQIRDAIEPLKVGDASQPIATSEGVLIVMVCSRDDPKTNLPDRDQVEQTLMGERLTMLARRHLRDLRLSSIVDLRV